jgi:hypothetical protein
MDQATAWRRLKEPRLRHLHNRRRQREPKRSYEASNTASPQTTTASHWRAAPAATSRLTTLETTYHPHG